MARCGRSKGPYLQGWSRSVNKFLITMMVLAAIGWIAYGFVYPSGTWRYKMTVAVETPEGIKMGSAVREVSIAAAPEILPEMSGLAAGAKGEAVVVDLGNRGQFFTLLGGHAVFADAFMGGLLTKEAIWNAKLHVKPGATKILKIEHYPKFVRFRDINDPKTVESLIKVGFCKKATADGSCAEKVDGSSSLSYLRMHPSYIEEDRFAEAFGQGVRLKSVTVEVTDEPVTWGIDQWLPWLAKVGMGTLGGGSFSGTELYERLSAWDFKKGDRK